MPFIGGTSINHTEFFRDISSFSNLKELKIDISNTSQLHFNKTDKLFVSKK